jgi:cellulose synthase (UDP-forming)
MSPFRSAGWPFAKRQEGWSLQHRVEEPRRSPTRSSRRRFRRARAALGEPCARNADAAVSVVEAVSASDPAHVPPAVADRAQEAHRGLEDDLDVRPSAPSEKEKYLFVRRRLWPLSAASLVSFSCLSISQVRFATQSPYLWLFLPLIAFSLLYYLTGVSVAVGTPGFDIDRHRRLVDAWSPRSFPSVDVFLPVCGEPLGVIRNAWEHVRRLRYPGELSVYCLDDGADPVLRQKCEEFGFLYLSRPDRGVMKKAGNLNYGFERSRGELIVIFDADFCPRVDMLLEMVPYFDAHPRLGILQTPQHFRVLRTQRWLERGAGAVQEFFYRAVQVSRNHHDGAVCVGTNAVYRREALAANGGPTQIGHSEDVHTGFDVRRHGWDLQYVPLILAIGICPDQRAAFLAQQYRWCTGSMSLLGSRKFWSTPMRVRTRLCYLSGFTHYVHTALFTFVAPAFPIVLLLFLPELVRLENYVFILPSVIYTLVVLRLWHRHPYGLDALAVRMVYGWAHAFAILDILRGRQKGWQPTGGQVAKTSILERQFRHGLVIWGRATACLWLGAAGWDGVERSCIDYGPILVMGLLYAAVLIAAGRPTGPPASELRVRERRPTYLRHGR